MSKRSSRPGREAIKEQKKEHKKAQRKLRAAQKAQGLNVPSSATIPNRKCPYQTVEEEGAKRLDAVSQQVKAYRSMLPVLLKRLSKIKDPRNPKKIKHKMSVLLIYGILCFAFQMASRREASREMTRPMFMANLRKLFPELEDLPHHDTLARILEQIEVNDIAQAHLDMIRHLIRGKKFLRYLIASCYPIAIDGTQKFKRSYLWDEECLERKVRTQKKDEQDCAQRAFKRLAEQLKNSFSHLPIMVLLDGLYPNGPIMEICRKNNWDFMIVLQDASLPSVWEEIKALQALQKYNRLRQT